MEAEKGYDLAWFRKHWRFLMFRWLIFAFVIAVALVATGESPSVAVFYGLGFGAFVNVAWCWVA